MRYAALLAAIRPRDPTGRIGSPARPGQGPADSAASFYQCVFLLVHDHLQFGRMTDDRLMSVRTAHAVAAAAVSPRRRLVRPWPVAGRGRPPPTRAFSVGRRRVALALG